MKAIDPSGPFGARSVAENYRRYLEPVLFAPWAMRLVQWAGVSPGDVVVDLAAGTGAVARAAARAAGSNGRVIANDLSVTMLDESVRTREPRAAAISQLVGPADRLDLPDSSVDVVLCQHGLTFMPDRAAALREARRVLRPGGALVVSVWADDERLDPFDAYAEALNESGAFGRRVSNDSVTMPVGDVVDGMIGAGLREVAVTRQTLGVRWPTLEAEIAGIYGTPFGPAVEAMDDVLRSAVMSALRERLAAHGGHTVEHATVSVFGRGIR